MVKSFQESVFVIRGVLDLYVGIVESCSVKTALQFQMTEFLSYHCIVGVHFIN